MKGTKTMENEIMNLRFNLTPKIQSLIIEMLVNKQMLEEGKVEAEHCLKKL